jgi:chlorobactene glucosyltransferase
VPARWAAWYPVANLVIDLILIQAIRMCVTGDVTWRGTRYGSVASRDADKLV